MESKRTGEIQVTLEGLFKQYGSTTAVDNVNLEIENGEVLVLLGPSGCGKTTTMRSIAGLDEPSGGRISVGGKTFFDKTRGINVPPNKRGVGMVFQSYAIWPHRTVFENVAYPLERQRLKRPAIERQVAETLEMVGLDKRGQDSASRLSGGQMQRVALARSLVMRPEVLLLDEPLSNLDARLRDRLRFELRELHQEMGTTSVYVTHDQSEALALADRIAVMKDGRIVQLADPVSLYRYPTNAFVAKFLGIANLWEGRVERGNGRAQVVLASGDAIPVSTTFSPGAAVTIGIRAEHLSVRLDPPPVEDTSSVQLTGKIRVASFLGAQVTYIVGLESGLEFQVSVSGSAQLLPINTPVWLECSLDDVLVVKDNGEHE